MRLTKPVVIFITCIVLGCDESDSSERKEGDDKRLTGSCTHVLTSGSSTRTICTNYSDSNLSEENHRNVCESDLEDDATAKWESGAVCPTSGVLGSCQLPSSKANGGTAITFFYPDWSNSAAEAQCEGLAGTWAPLNTETKTPTENRENEDGMVLPPDITKDQYPKIDGAAHGTFNGQSWRYASAAVHDARDYLGNKIEGEIVVHLGEAFFPEPCMTSSGRQRLLSFASEAKIGKIDYEDNPEFGLKYSYTGSDNIPITYHSTSGSIEISSIEDNMLVGKVSVETKRGISVSGAFEAKDCRTTKD